MSTAIKLKTANYVKTYNIDVNTETFVYQLNFIYIQTYNSNPLFGILKFFEYEIELLSKSYNYTI